ncbi:MAG: arylsulfatase [Verrucomicrobia bacterium]|nr:arylsulfatase [Verrucomicrobiota bacterium]
MNLRNHILLLIGTLIVLPLSGKLPNILLILVDDMGWSDIGCYGGEVHTPNLDELAENGLRFTQFHNTSKCFPSRSCLMTGLYAQQNGNYRKFGPYTNAVTIGEVLRTAGYRTFWVGKHHSTENAFDRGFDHYYGLLDGASNHWNPGNQRKGEPRPGNKAESKPWRTYAFDEKVLKPYTPPNKDYYSTDAYTDWALGFMERYRHEEKPYFMYLSYQAPHDPLHAWPEDVAKYIDHYRVGYQAIAKARYKKQKAIGLIDETFPRSEPIHVPWDKVDPVEKEKEIKRMAVYAAMIDRVDQSIGRIREKIQSMGEEENTLILFASDNGSSGEDAERKAEVKSGPLGSFGYWASLGRDWANVSNTPYRLFKNNSHEGGICTPLIAFWPEGIRKPNRISTFRGHFIDIMATLVDITGATYPKTYDGKNIVPMQGVSLNPVFQGSTETRKEPIFWKWSRGWAVTDGKWKLVSSDGSKTIELFDTFVDRTETNELGEQNPEVVKHLLDLHADWLVRCEVDAILNQ